MTSIMALTDGILDLIPKPDQRWRVYRQTAPKPADKPPWIIETVTTNGHIVGETQRLQCGRGALSVRIVSTTVDSVNVIADDLMIPTLTGISAHVEGYSTGALTLSADSGAYAAGLTAEETSLLYQCRLLTFVFLWSRK